jgi:hypothetical protein
VAGSRMSQRSAAARATESMARSRRRREEALSQRSAAAKVNGP